MRRSARSINVCERTDGLWGLPPELMCRVQRGKTWYSGSVGVYCRRTRVKMEILVATMTGDPAYWYISDLVPAWLYLSVSTLAAPVLLRACGNDKGAPTWFAAVLPVAVVVWIGSLVPAAFGRAVHMSGKGLTGTIYFLGATWVPHIRDQLLVSKGLLLGLACFGWAQIVLLVVRAERRRYMRYPKPAIVLIAVVCWNPLNWLSDWWKVWELNYYLAILLSVVAGTPVGRGLAAGVVGWPGFRRVRLAEASAMLAGGLAAVWAFTSPHRGLGFAPFLASAGVMFAISAVRADATREDETSVVG